MRPFPKILLLGSLLVNVVFMFGSIASRAGILSTSSDCASSGVKKSDGASSRWPQHNSVIYGHIHLAKTAGTTINGELAMKYERVCGHKGYSYDAYRHNDRGEKWTTIKHPGEALPVEQTGGGWDSFSKLQKNYNRGRVPFGVMDEIGYHDCDWISNEQPFSFWQKLAKEVHPVPLELHVPCRQPIDYLLSMCNHNSKQFNCDIGDDKIPAEVDKCLITMNRFSEEVSKIPTNTTLKCYNPVPVDDYLNYMGTRLQPRRFVRSYIHRHTNKPRDKSKECLQNNKKMREKVENYVIEHIPIFRFCYKCMGSQDDLLIASAS